MSVEDRSINIRRGMLGNIPPTVLAEPRGVFKSMSPQYQKQVNMSKHANIQNGFLDELSKIAAELGMPMGPSYADPVDVPSELTLRVSSNRRGDRFRRRASDRGLNIRSMVAAAPAVDPGSVHDHEYWNKKRAIAPVLPEDGKSPGYDEVLAELKRLAARSKPPRDPYALATFNQ